jgi:hypothetical protein
MCGWIIRVSGGTMGTTAVNIVAICIAVAASEVLCFALARHRAARTGRGW